VRDTELLIKKLGAPPQEPKEATPEAKKPDVHTRAAEDRMRFAIGSRVRIIRRGSGGVIQIDFGSENELNRIYELLTATS
jgi:ParB family chromosome partitioning protein